MIRGMTVCYAITVLSLAPALLACGNGDKDKNSSDEPNKAGGSSDSCSIKLFATQSVDIGDTASLRAKLSAPTKDNGEPKCDISGVSVGFSHVTEVVQNPTSSNGEASVEWEATWPGGDGKVEVTASVPEDLKSSYDPDSDSETITVNPPKITQLNQKQDAFPKCKGQNVSLSDFNYDTDPHSFKPDVAIKELKPDMSDTKGQHTAVLWIMDGSTGIKGTEQPVKYEVLGPGDVSKETLHPKVVSDSFSKVIVRYVNIAAKTVVEYERSGRIVGRGTYQEVGGTSWTSCGGSVAKTKKVTFEGGGTIGVTWKAANADITFSYSSTTSETLTATPVNGKRIRLVGHEQSIDLTTNYNNHRKRTGEFTMGGIMWDPAGWQSVNSSGHESQSGWAPGTQQKWEKCCS